MFNYCKTITELLYSCIKISPIFLKLFFIFTIFGMPNNRKITIMFSCTMREGETDRRREREGDSEREGEGRKGERER